MQYVPTDSDDGSSTETASMDSTADTASGIHRTDVDEDPDKTFDLQLVNMGV